jgi:hypothetical protein
MNGANAGDKVLPAFQTRRPANYGAMAVRYATDLTERLEAQADDNGPHPTYSSFCRTGHRFT